MTPPIHLSDQDIESLAPDPENPETLKGDLVFEKTDSGLLKRKRDGEMGQMEFLAVDGDWRWFSPWDTFNGMDLESFLISLKNDGKIITRSKA